MSGVTVSKTIPFVNMPLDYSRAFGGKAIHPSEVEATEPNNPLGRGWSLSASNAVGTRLPNVEEVDQRITKWNQTAMPASLLPLPRTSALRGTRGIDVNLEKGTTKFTPLAFTSSHPRMHLPGFPAGAPISIVGLSDRPWQFHLPSLSLSAEITLGQNRHCLRLTPDTLCMVPSQRRFWIVYRRAFVYQFRPERLRQIRILQADSTSHDTSTTTIAKELGSASPIVHIESPDAPENMPIPWDTLREVYPLTDIIENLPLLASS
jgi:hypothetical protein